MDKRSAQAAAYRSQYKTARWIAKAKRQLTIEPLCRMCKRDGRVTQAQLADHIDPHRGNLDKFWNGLLQSLCWSCHSSRKQLAEIHGYTTEVDPMTGLYLDPKHPSNERSTSGGA